MRLLIVESDARLFEALAAELGAAGFESACATSIAAAQGALRAGSYAALIVGLADEEATRHLVSSLRDIPVLMLSACAPREKLRALADGAGDDPVKHFVFEELVARVRALLRRQGQVKGDLLRAGNVSLHTGARQVFVEDKPHAFSAGDVALLEILLRRPGLIIPRQMVEDYLFGLTDEVRGNAVEVRVHRLRKQLKDSGANIEVHTVRGIGYLLREMAAGHAPAKTAVAMMHRDAALLN